MSLQNLQYAEKTANFKNRVLLRKITAFLNQPNVCPHFCSKHQCSQLYFYVCIYRVLAGICLYVRPAFIYFLKRSAKNLSMCRKVYYCQERNKFCFWGRKEAEVKINICLLNKNTKTRFRSFTETYLLTTYKYVYKQSQDRWSLTFQSYLWFLQ